MKGESYPLIHSEDYCYFEFVSKSEIRSDRKVVKYTPIKDDPNCYNLFLAHVLPDGTLCERTVTNNHDMKNVMATIIQTIFLFLYTHESNSIYFSGNTYAKTRLYRGVISREFSEAKKYFDIYGVTESGKESFQPNKDYKGYEIRLKHTSR